MNCWSQRGRIPLVSSKSNMLLGQKISGYRNAEIMLWRLEPISLGCENGSSLSCSEVGPCCAPLAQDLFFWPGKYHWWIFLQRACTRLQDVGTFRHHGTIMPDSLFLAFTLFLFSFIHPLLSFCSGCSKGMSKRCFTIPMRGVRSCLYALAALRLIFYMLASSPQAARGDFAKSIFIQQWLRDT